MIAFGKKAKPKAAWAEVILSTGGSHVSDSFKFNVQYIADA